jgi:hypothetical protein
MKDEYLIFAIIFCKITNKLSIAVDYCPITDPAEDLAKQGQPLRSFM